jgi:hypothetical protein
MANDVLASRREARRRRILENSENRLQKITGRSDSISNGNMKFFLMLDVSLLGIDVFTTSWLCVDKSASF